jgi:hypothetical protein
MTGSSGAIPVLMNVLGRGSDGIDQEAKDPDVAEGIPLN